MKTRDFDFYLPEHLIAQQPPKERGQSRLMTLDRITGERAHRTVLQLPDILCGERFLSPQGEAPLLVFNDTKVRKARLRGVSQRTGAESEFLLLDDVKKDGILWKTIVKHKRRKKTGDIYLFHGIKASVSAIEGEFLFLEFENAVNDDWLDKNGAVPLPPYIKRKNVPEDNERYQTVYAKQSGSAAAPTAGLHFTEELLASLKERGIGSAFVTLHAGLGTFLPVRSENIEEHVMHEECFFITEENAALIESAFAKKRKIIAVGTTSLRSLESAFSDGGLKRGRQSTSIFIYPGYRFKTIDALFTNFHTPLSTLLMLVCAFAGKDLILETYAEAVKENYRFFSYGDAMLIY